MVILADNTEFSKYPQLRMTMHKILSQTFDLKYRVNRGQQGKILGTLMLVFNTFYFL